MSTNPVLVVLVVLFFTLWQTHLQIHITMQKLSASCECFSVIPLAYPIFKMQWTSSVLSEPLFLLSVFRTPASALISSHEYTIKRPLKSIVITDYTECLWFCHLSWKGGSGARCQGFISPIWLARTDDPLVTVTGNAAAFSFVAHFHLISCNA